MNWLIQHLRDSFRSPSPMELAARELAELEHSQLKATATREWAYHRIKYIEQRTGYLKNFLSERAQS